MGLLDNIGNIMGTNGAPAAIAAQTSAQEDAQGTLTSTLQQQQAQEAPWQAAGTSALSQMENPAFQSSFNLSDFQQDPGYQFQLQQGQQAIDRAGAAGGVSGGSLKSLQSYSQGLANQDYQQAYQNYNTNQTNQFNRLSTLAGYGQNANAMVDQNLTNYGNTSAGLQMGLGNAIASADMGQASQNAQMMTGLMTFGGGIAGSGNSGQNDDGEDNGDNEGGGGGGGSSAGEVGSLAAMA